MKKGFLKKVLLLASFCFVFTGVLTLQEKTAYAAASPVTVSSVEYNNEQIIVNNNGNSKICFATEAEAANDNWEVIDADTGSTTWIDISWLSPTVENILFIKGADDSSATKARVILRERPNKLEVSINYENLGSLADSATIASLVNIMSTVGTGEAPIVFTDLEWKKGASGQWQSTNSLTAEKLKKYMIKGTYLYFRIKAIDDATKASATDIIDGTAGRRCSNEIKIKVAKQAAASNYTIDGEKFNAEIKYGKEYRVTANGTTSNWVQVIDRTTKTISLKTIITKALPTSTYDGSTSANAFPAMKLEIRDYASTKSAASKVTEITINAQRTITETVTEGPAPSDAVSKSDSKIYVSYNGNKNMVLEIPLATTALPYEYCVVKKGDTYDVSKAVWTSITKGTAVKIVATKAVEGGKLYIRQKELKSSDPKKVTVASTYASCDINYPALPEIIDTEYTFTRGYSDAITFDITMTTSGKKPFETEVKSIKLGTKVIDFTSDPTTLGTTGTTLKITLKKDALAALPNCYRKAITIIYGNGTVDKTSIMLTVQSPAAAGGLAISYKAGSTAGMTNLSIDIQKAATDNKWFYVTTTAAITGVNNVDKVSKYTATPTELTTVPIDIAITANQYLTVFEVNKDGYIVKFKSVQITSTYIK